jgi:hypothetical protein
MVCPPPPFKSQSTTGCKIQASGIYSVASIMGALPLAD